MSKIPTYFVRPCGVCGRTLQIPVTLLGDKATCEHCGATFVAHDPNRRRPTVDEVVSEFGQRVDMLLTTAHNQRNRGMAISDADFLPETMVRRDVPSSRKDA